MKISFDFDGTLRTYDGDAIERVQKILLGYQKKGNKVIIITARNPEDTHVGMDGEQLQNYLKRKFGDIPVYYTNGELKWKILKKERVDLHYDDSPEEIQAIKDNTDIETVFINDDDTEERQDSLDLKAGNVDNGKKYGDKTVLVFDHGMYFSVAKRLSEDFGKTLYYTPWENAFPDSNLTLLGYGFPEVQRVDNFWKYYDSVDLFVFTDIYHSDLQNYLASQGKRVWGARSGDAMEIYRWDFLQYMEKIGLAIPPSNLVIGMDALRKELKKRENVFIKMDAKERGDAETFHHISYDLTSPVLDDLQFKLGAKAPIKKFIIQEPIETDHEIGYDGWCIDGQFPDTCLWGMEVKDKGYIGKVQNYADIPKEIRQINDALSATMKKKYGYRANWSTEIRVGKDGTPYLIDPTCRFPMPPTGVMMALIENWSEIIYEGANGTMIQPKWRADYGGEILLYSDFASNHFYSLQNNGVEVSIPCCCMIDGKTYCVPQKWDNKMVGEVVAIGKSADQVVNLLSEQCSKIQGYQLRCDERCLDEPAKQL